MRETRIAAIDDAIAQIEERERERIAREEAEVESGLRRRSDCDLTIRESAQINFTDPDSRIVPQASGGFEQAYNAQAAVDVGSGLIVHNSVSQRPNDARLLEDAVKELLGSPQRWAESTRFSPMPAIAASATRRSASRWR